jgi:hypothetical protein
MKSFKFLFATFFLFNSGVSLGQIDLYNNAMKNYNNNQARSNQANINELWKNLRSVDQNFNLLLKQPQNNMLYNASMKTLREAYSMQGNLSYISPSESKQLQMFEGELVKKATQIDKLRLQANPNSLQNNVFEKNATVPNNSNADVQQFSTGFTDALKNNEAKSKELDEDLRQQREGKAAVEEEVKQDIHSSFSNIMAGEKAPPKVAGNCNPGSGYDTVLFQDAFVIVKYKLKLAKAPISCDKYLDTKKQVVPFCGYYYQATCTIINRQNKKLAIRGGINGGPTFDNKKHISPVGEIGKLFFGNDTSSFYNIFYYGWDFTLTNPEITQEGFFWTEIANEKPAFTISYNTIK